MKFIKLIPIVLAAVLIYGLFSDNTYYMHFESECDTIISGTDTIVNCYLRCSNPPLGKDTASPLGQYAFIEAVVTWDTGGAVTDSIVFQTWNGKAWVNQGVWRTDSTDMPYMCCVLTGHSSNQARYRIGQPYPLKVRAVLANLSYYAARTIRISWEGSGD